MIYIPVGCSCDVANYLKNKHLRNCAYPFDWLCSSLDNITDCIEHDFKDLFKNVYKIIDTPQTYIPEDGTRNRKIMITHICCKIYDIFSFHDVIANSSFEEEMENVREKYARRIQRFKESCNGSEEVCFVMDKCTYHNKINERSVLLLQNMTGKIMRFIVMIKNYQYRLRDSTEF